MAEVNNNGGGGVSKWDKLVERLRSRYAERKFENEDDMYGAAMDEWDEMEGENRKRKDEDAAAMAALEKCPAAMMFLSAILNGGEEAEALADLKDYFELSAEDKEKHNAKLKKQMEDDEAARKAAEIYEANWEKTAEALSKWAEENGLTVEEACKMVNDFIEQFVMKFRNGTLDKGVFEMMFRLLNYDKDMAAAKEAGRKEGMNEGIRRKAEKKVGDGLPNVSGGGSAPQEKMPEANDLLSRLRRANDQRGVLG